MSANLGAFLILAAAFLAAVTMVLGRATISAKTKRIQLAGNDRMTELQAENDALRARLTRQDERLAVLERIATDPAERTAREIEQLRD